MLNGKDASPQNTAKNNIVDCRDHPVFENRNEALKEYSTSFLFSNVRFSHRQMDYNCQTRKYGKVRTK
jgi:hypothetical protein